MLVGPSPEERPRRETPPRWGAGRRFCFRAFRRPSLILREQRREGGAPRQTFSGADEARLHASSTDRCDGPPVDATAQRFYRNPSPPRDQDKCLSFTGKISQPAASSSTARAACRATR